MPRLGVLAGSWGSETGRAAGSSGVGVYAQGPAVGCGGPVPDADAGMAPPTPTAAIARTMTSVRLSNAFFTGFSPSVADPHLSNRSTWIRSRKAARRLRPE